MKSKFILVTAMILVFASSAFAQFNNPTFSTTLRLDSADGKDANVASFRPDRNYGDYINIQGEAWTNGGAASHNRALFEFDLSVLPANIIIVEAKLDLYFAPQDDGEFHSIVDGPNNSTLSRITSSWTEYGVTWNNVPQYTFVNSVNLASSTSMTQNYLNIDVANLVQDMVDQPNSSFGFHMKLDNESYYRRMVFASSDYVDQTKHPRLRLKYKLATAISDEELAFQDFKMYPNPVSTQLSIVFNREQQSDVQIDILTMNGSLVYSHVSTDMDTQTPIIVNVGNLAKGVYFLRLTNKEAVLTKKIVIQ